MMITVDTLVRNIGQLVNPASDRVARGREAGFPARPEHDVCIAARQGKIRFIGPEKDLAASCRLEPGGLEAGRRGAAWRCPGWSIPTPTCLSPARARTNSS